MERVTRVHIEVQRVRKRPFSVPRLRRMVGANALLGPPLRVDLPELSRQTERGWTLTPIQEALDPVNATRAQADEACVPNKKAYLNADPNNPLRDHDDPTGDAKAGILSRDGGHFEARFANGAKAIDEAAARSEWLGARTHEGFGRFRADTSLPGVTSETASSREPEPIADDLEETIAETTKEWFTGHELLAKTDKKDRDGRKPPSLSQWFDLVRDLERGDPAALSSRLRPTTAGGRSWTHEQAKAILNRLNDQNLPPDSRPLHARYFVRWLRAAMRKETR